MRFRCESLAHYANDLYDYVKSLNPNVSVLFNIKGVYSFNRYWVNAVYHPLYANRIDVMSFDTGGYDARIDSKTGALVSQIRSYKVARRLKASCEEPLQDDLRCALDMAFDYETPVTGNPGVALHNACFHPARSNFTANTSTAIIGARKAWPTWPCCTPGRPWRTASATPTFPPR